MLELCYEVILITYSLLTFHEGRSKTGLLHGPVRDELDIELAGGGLDVLRHLVAAVSADEGGLRVGAVPYLDVVVDAVVVVLDLKGLELERHLEPEGHLYLPRTLLVGLVVAWVVGGLKLSGLG